MSKTIEEQITKRLTKPIVLIGMMGSGKSHAGAVLAKALGLPFMDSDQEVEKRAGGTIAEIFERDGEEKFRTAEKNTILELLEIDNLVLSTGGGAIMTPEVADAVWSKAISIWITAEKEILVKRLQGKKDRPLLAGGDIEAKIEGLLKERQPIYEKADIVIDTSEMHVENTLQDMLQALDQFLDEEK